MRYFPYLPAEEEERIFFSPPASFDNRSDRELLAYAVGAALYMPATREHIAEEIAAGKHEGLVSIVMDLEDAVADNQALLAENMLKNSLAKLRRAVRSGLLHPDRLPLLFVRVRSAAQLRKVLDFFEDELEVLTGFVFPKFNASEGEEYFRLLAACNGARSLSSPVLYGMPILETAEVIYRESRIDALNGIARLLERYRDYVLNVRIGATDFSSLFGLRRSPDNTIYDLAVIRDCIADIVNIFGRAKSDFVISGPVWEYFKSDRVLKPQLRQTPFEESKGGPQGRMLRMSYINRYVDGLIREVAMDKENGILGKTIIHPTHIKPVQAMYVVTHEEYLDALHIVENSNGDYGVLKSRYANKMNEIKPHLAWAGRILMRANVYGVLNEHQNFTCLLEEDRESATVSNYRRIGSVD